MRGGPLRPGAGPPLLRASRGWDGRGLIEASQASQQKQNAQLTSIWWRRMAMSERTWKSAQPSSSLTCLYDCSTQCRSP